jgi:hypothetical protein
MLRSLKEIQGYTIHSSDGPIGSVEQFFFDDQTWMIQYERSFWLQYSGKRW